MLLLWILMIIMNYEESCMWIMVIEWLCSQTRREPGSNSDRNRIEMVIQCIHNMSRLSTHQYVPTYSLNINCRIVDDILRLLMHRYSFKLAAAARCLIWLTPLRTRLRKMIRVDGFALIFEVWSGVFNLVH